MGGQKAHGAVYTKQGEDHLGVAAMAMGREYQTGPQIPVKERGSEKMFTGGTIKKVKNKAPSTVPTSRTDRGS